MLTILLCVLIAAYTITLYIAAYNEWRVYREIPLGKTLKIKEFSSQNQALVEDCKSTIREIELEHQKTIQSLSRCSQSLYNEANAVLKNTHDLMIINGLLSERIQTLLKYATTSLEPEQESKLIEEITSAINHIKMENEQIAHHRQDLEKAMRDIEQHDLEVAQKQELKEIQGHHFGGLSI